MNLQRTGQSFIQTILLLAILPLSCAAYAEPQRNKEPQYNEELQLNEELQGKESQDKESQGKAPQRIVSLNLCIDQLLLALVPKTRIASVTYLSTNKQLSTIADQLDGIYINHGLAEEIVPLQPDLIIASEFGATDAVRLLQQLGFDVERVQFPLSLGAVIQHIETLGALVGSEAAAHDMAQQIHTQLTAADELASFEPAPTAIWYSPNGVVAGNGTLEHELMTRAGFRNLAAESGIAGFAQMDLEQLVIAAPQALIVEGGYVDSFSVAREYLQHPALKLQSRVIELPAAISVCSAPAVADVLRVLREQREISH